MPETANSSLTVMEHNLCGHWLNTYCRETGRFDVRLSALLAGAAPELASLLNAAAEALCRDGHGPGTIAAIRFTHARHTLLAPLKHFSPGGYHQYGCPLLWCDETRAQVDTRPPPERLAAAITAELASGKPDPRAAALCEQMINGLEKMRCFSALREDDSAAAANGKLTPLIAAEQSLLMGHPFHVTAKSSHGFSAEDLKKYSPELHASFQLHYFAITPTLIAQRGLAGDALPRDRGIPARVRTQLDAEFSHYHILPVHPWQARYLLAQPEIARLRQQQLLIPLGAQGEPVWPTSSVRTVWLPQERCFLKLALNVRITNFLRNNPPAHGERALDASRAVCSLPLELWRSRRFYVVVEEGYQLLNSETQALQAATLVIQRQGLRDDCADRAQVLAALLEENPATGEIALLAQLREAADYRGQTLAADVVDIWWQLYLRISLLPLLRLYADAGISLEGHLQNCLLACENGWPQRFYVRDMEGVSIDRSCYLRRREACLSEQSPALYDAGETWFRFKYYVIVNHISHFIACLARTGLTDEQRLWRCVDQLLDDVALPRARPLVDDLRHQPTLPAKHNMMSCFRQHGETPSWGAIPNPLHTLWALPGPDAADPERHPQSYTRILDSNAYRLAQQRVIRQVLEALLYEQVVKPSRYENDTLDLSARVAAGGSDEEVFYRCRAVKTPSFNRIRLLSDEVVRVYSHSGTVKKQAVLSVTTLLEELTLAVEVEPQSWRAFIRELLHTTFNHGQSRLQSHTALLRGAGSDYLEARLSDGHPYHPTFKSRIGFDAADNARFGPELSPGLQPILLAARKSHCHWSLSGSLDGDDFFAEELGPHWHDRLAALGLPAADYLPLPLHPWQWSNVISPLYQDAFCQRDLVLLGPLSDRYLPQQSIRTLSNLSRPQNSYLKLAMSLLNTSTQRVLPAHTVCNAAPISDWLARVIAADTALPEAHKPLLLKEVAAVGFTPARAGPEHRGALACIWRQSVFQVAGRGHTVPLQALTAVDGDSRPFIDTWIERHGAVPWLTQLVERVYLPVLHMLWAHGIALESHAQNMGLQHDQGLPQRAVLKDFHDGVRFNRRWLSDASVVEQLTEAPPEHRRINPNSYLEEKSAEALRDFVYDALFFVNLAELAWLLSRHYGLAEVEFWTTVAERIRAYQRAHPQLHERFALFDLFAPQVNIEKLASRRFMGAGQPAVLPAANPLYLITL